MKSFVFCVLAAAVLFVTSNVATACDSCCCNPCADLLPTATVLQNLLPDDVCDGHSMRSSYDLSTSLLSRLLRMLSHQVGAMHDVCSSVRSRSRDDVLHGLLATDVL